MSLRIKHIDPDGLAQQYGLKAGDELLKINGKEINDRFDLAYYSSEYELNILIKTAEQKLKRVKIQRDSLLHLGIEPQEQDIRLCHNKCVFCFVDQMPKGLRKSLYVKDDDYLMSWEFGNYITLTNLSEAEIQRIIKQGITPLYISVHSTRKELRQEMMGYKKDFDILKLLKRFSAAGISFHTQIVCVPNINDGIELERTITELTNPELNTLSIGVVPVGLTKYRKHRAQLQAFDKHRSALVLSLIHLLRKETGSSIIYAADEFYVLADKRLPSKAYYQDYPQAENGIGLLSLLRSGFTRHKKNLVQSLDAQEHSYLLLHSQAAAKEMTKITSQLKRMLQRSKLSSKSIRNDFFGPHVNVSGLLTASDILGQHKSKTNQSLILPANMFNDEGFTLDGWDLASLKAELKCPIVLMHPLFESLSFH